MGLGRVILVAGCVAVSAAACGGKGGTTATSPTPAPTSIQTIVQVTGSRLFILPIALGQSVAVQGGPFNNVRFKWEVAENAPVVGSLYILSQEYLGVVSALGAATPGFVARSIRIEDGEYVFDSAVVLRPGVTYWFMADREVKFFASIGTTDVYPGGDLYTASQVFDTAFQRYVPVAPTDRVDASFLLRGSLTTGP